MNQNPCFYGIKLKLILAAFIFIFSLSYSVKAQTVTPANCDSLVLPIPDMYVWKKYGMPREKMFKDKLKNLHKKYNSNDSSISFDAHAFENMSIFFRDNLKVLATDSVWVFFASKNLNPDSLLTLIFSVRVNNVFQNYIISGSTYMAIDNATAYKWEQNYFDNIMPYFKMNLDKNDDSSRYYYNNGKDSISDTRCIRYLFGRWTQYFITEIDYQNCKFSANIDSIKVVFAAFSKTHGDGVAHKNKTDSSKTNYFFKSRLHVIYEFMSLNNITGKTVPYSIEAQNGFGRRPKPATPGRPFHAGGGGTGGGADNGNLCPPDNNCPGS